MNRTDEELIASAKQGREMMGYRDLVILDQRLIRLPASYPVLTKGFEPVLEQILAEMDELGNFRTIGRHGAFNYIGTLDAMDVGYGAADWLTTRKGSAGSWKEERERTRHYPVLD